MRYLITGLAIGLAVGLLYPAFSGPYDNANNREVGVEWVNDYYGWASTLSQCDDDAVGFYNTMGAKGWTQRWNWGDSNAWEQDFKEPSKPGGGTDTTYADNVDFAYFSGHGNANGFYFGTTIDDHGLSNTDAIWGNKDLEWIALSSCLVLNYSAGGVFSRWGWPVFQGLHGICGMDTVMSDTPNQGAYFARFMTGDWNYPSWGARLPVREAWRQAAWWALPAGQYCAILGASRTGADTWNEYLDGYGPVVADPTPPSWLWYVRYPCG